MKTSFTLMLLLCTALAAAVHAGQDLGRKEEQVVTRVPFDASQWTLVWAEEFDSPGAPDPAKWALEEGYLRNNEEQYYTAGRLENARVEDGKLIIEARRDHWQGHPITSASLTTLGKREFLYGRIAVRAKIPTGRGTWPAIWTLGLPAANEKLPDWPDCGEIDIMENVGKDPAKIHANLHCAAYNHMKRNWHGNFITATAPWEDFHEYAVEWYPDRMEFFFDDQRYFVYRKESDDPAVWPYAQPHYLILCLAIGGAWGGEVDLERLPHRFEIDYVRHYQPRRQ